MLIQTKNLTKIYTTGEIEVRVLEPLTIFRRRIRIEDGVIVSDSGGVR